MKKMFILMLTVLMALSLVLITGCQKKDATTEMKEKAAETAGEVKEKAAETAGEVKEKAAETAAEVKEKAAETAGAVKEKAAETAEKAPAPAKKKTAGY